MDCNQLKYSGFCSLAFRLSRSENRYGERLKLMEVRLSWYCSSLRFSSNKLLLSSRFRDFVSLIISSRIRILLEFSESCYRYDRGLFNSNPESGYTIRLIFLAFSGSEYARQLTKLHAFHCGHLSEWPVKYQWSWTFNSLSEEFINDRWLSTSCIYVRMSASRTGCRWDSARQRNLSHSLNHGSWR